MGLKKSLQQKWQFVQQVIAKDVGAEFQGVEWAITQTFLSAIFDDSYSDNINPQHLLASLSVKFDGLTIPNPTASVERPTMMLQHTCSMLPSTGCLLRCGKTSASHP
jgi:hypothetical protein